MAATPHHAALKRALPWSAAAPQRRRIPSQIPTTADLAPPMGGIGAGTLNLGANGGLVQCALLPWAPTPQPWKGAGISAFGDGTAVALMPADRAATGWKADPAGSHHALYPKGWHLHSLGCIAVSVEQLSPVFPGGTDTDLPVGVLRAHLTNNGTVPCPAAVMVSLPNLLGGTTPESVPEGQFGVADDTGVTLHRRTVGAPGPLDGTMALAVAPAPGLQITACPAFDPAADGASLWTRFAAEGRIGPAEPWETGGAFAEHPAPVAMAAIAARADLAPGETRTVDIALAWDMPILRFGRGRVSARHYASRWGRSGGAARAIATHALAQAEAWSRAIDAFHTAALGRLAVPDAIAATVINELYLLAAGSVWTAPDDDGPARFAPLECPDYPLLGTFDLWTYAAAAVDPLFPDLGDTALDAFAHDLPRADPTPRRHLKSPARIPRKRAGWLAHDLGGPAGDPFVDTNDYVYQDSARWKDLNAMFAIEAWRSARRGGSRRARTLYPAVREAMTVLATADRDGDGVIENDGTPDQTFDNIPMSGISATCGGLWLAAVRAAAALADAAGSPDGSRWRDLSARAEPAFHAALWTGTHFRLDTRGPFTEAILSEQCHAPAVARSLGLGDIVSPDDARRALATVMARNFHAGGKGRAAILVASPGPVSPHAESEAERGLQWDEALIGCNYSLAAALRIYGMDAEFQALTQALAMEIARRGFAFRTPAAFAPADDRYRAAVNLRPLGAWALGAEACEVPSPPAHSPPAQSPPAS